MLSSAYSNIEISFCTMIFPFHTSFFIVICYIVFIYLDSRSSHSIYFYIYLFHYIIFYIHIPYIIIVFFLFPPLNSSIWNCTNITFSFFLVSLKIKVIQTNSKISLPLHIHPNIPKTRFCFLLSCLFFFFFFYKPRRLIRIQSSDLT